MASNSKALKGALTDSDILVGTGDLRAAPEVTGAFDLIRGTATNNILTGTEAQEYIFGSRGNDSLLGDAGVDILSGGVGKDTMNTGSGLGVHIGGAGGDTYQIGDDILSNGVADTIIAFGFNPAKGDVLDFGEGITGVVQATLAGEDTTTLSLSDGANFADIIAELEGVSIKGDKDLKAFQKFLALADAEGNIANATTVEIANGDKIIVTGVNVETLVAVLDATVNPA